MRIIKTIVLVQFEIKKNTNKKSILKQNVIHEHNHT